MFSYRYKDLLLAGGAVLVSVALAFAHADLEQQIARVTKQIESDPGNATLYLQRGELHRLHREWDDAETDYARAARLDPSLIAVELARGMMLSDSGNPDEAKTHLDRFLAAQPDHVNALATRARVLADLGRRLAAAEDYSRAIRLSTNPQPEFYLERARALTLEGGEHFAEALRGLDEGIQKLGPVATLELAAIDLELQIKRYDDALARLDAVAAQSGRKETWLARRGEMLEQAGRPGQARKAYADALAAIESLTPRARKVPATAELEAKVRSALQRLEGDQ
jgi:tetratricopeptide (TPR) repeat protein